MMKRFLLMAIVVASATLAFGQQTKHYSLSDFTGIDASSAFDITVSKGNKPSATITANPKVLTHIVCEVKGSKLELSLKSTNQLRNIGRIKVSVVMSDFNNLSMSGACKVSTRGTFSPKSFSADLSGASKVNLNLNTDKLSIDASGASNISLSGATKELNLQLSGSSKADASNLLAKTASVDASGNSVITVNVSDELDVDASGLSKINYKGKPNKIKQDVSGLSKLNRIP